MTVPLQGPRVSATQRANDQRPDMPDRLPSVKPLVDPGGKPLVGAVATPQRRWAEPSIVAAKQTANAARIAGIKAGVGPIDQFVNRRFAIDAPTRAPPQTPVASVHSQGNMSEPLSSGQFGALQTPEQEAAPVLPELQASVPSQAAIPELLSSDEPDAPQPSQEEAAPVLQESAASVQAGANGPPGSMTDHDVLTIVRQLAEDAKKQPAQRAAAFKDLSGLLVSHNFDFRNMSATNVAALYLAVVPFAEELRKDAPAVFEPIKTTFNDRFAHADADSLAEEASKASKEDRGVLAEAIPLMPMKVVAQLFVAIQRLPGELTKHADPFMARMTGMIQRMDVETFNFLAKEFRLLTVSGKRALRTLMATDRSGIETRLMKELLRPIVAGAKAKSPRDISHAVEVAKRTHAALLALALAPAPEPSDAEQLEALQNAMSASLAAHYMNDYGVLQQIFGGVSASWINTRVVVTKDKNAVSAAAGRYLLGYSTETRTETRNVKLVHHALSDAVRSRS